MKRGLKTCSEHCHSTNKNDLRWYGAPTCYDELFIEINNKIECKILRNVFHAKGV